MFVVSNFFSALANVVDIVLNILFWLIFARAAISWVNPDPYNQIVQFLDRITEPILAPIRRLFPAMPIDISPLIVCLVIFFLRKFLVPTLYDIGFSVR
jgi:YggT family protein